MEYLTVLLFFSIIAVFFHWRFRLPVFRSLREAILIILWLAFIGSVWDTFAIWRGHWQFPTTHLVGIQIGLMPIEEYLFMLTVPYDILVTYHFLQNYITRGKNPQTHA